MCHFVHWKSILRHANLTGRHKPTGHLSFTVCVCVCVGGGALAFRQTSANQLKEIHLQSSDFCLNMFLGSDVAQKKRHCGKVGRVDYLASGLEP